MRPFARLVLVALTFLPFRAAAADPAYSATHRQCMTRADGVTASMVACITAEYRRVDARLNAAYRVALRQRPDRRDALVRAERAWLAYRTANCDYYLDPDGGTLARVAANDCVLRMTVERALELEAIAADGAR
ncbi:MAG TPA: lysozyme inhibitor LprI family protein [Lysobacter sp.]|nr:lysozyme inhibitor LprI family protein [Lysobacter sp.]